MRQGNLLRPPPLKTLLNLSTRHLYQLLGLLARKTLNSNLILLNLHLLPLQCLRKAKKEKVASKPKKSSESASTDAKLADLDSKWSERFSRLEALLLSKSFQPTFSSDIKLTPSHSPPTVIPRDSEPFFQPTGRTGTASSADTHQAASQPESDSHSTNIERTGKGSSTSQYQPASQLTSDTQQITSASSKRTGKGCPASQHQPASQLSTDRPSSRSPHRQEFGDSDKGSSASQHQPTDQPITGCNRPSGQASTDPQPKLKSASRSHSKQRSDRPLTSTITDTGSPLHRHRTDSASSDISEAVSELSDRPAVDLYTEEGELSDEPDLTNEPEFIPSEEQTYRETMKGIRSIWAGQKFLNWTVLILGRMTIHFQDLKLQHQGKYPSKCLLKIGFARR